VDRYTGQPRVARDGALIVIAVGTGAELLAGAAGGTWEGTQTPAGDVRGLAVHEGTVLLLVRDGTGAPQVYQRPG
jgi:hypothetical protein